MHRSPARPSSRSLWLTLAMAGILFCSGLCALVYQTVWLREFRLIFGGAAPAAAAVLAVFMAGLGIGGWWFGRLIERVAFPFRFYVKLEVAIAVTAMATPYLLGLARSLYIASGGVQTLGTAGATLVQILMTVLVLGPPCFLMGGTLPAAMKFAQRDDDPRRSATAFFYAINVAGAVTGAALSTFWMLGAAGNRGTLSMAALLNAALAAVAWLIAQASERKNAPEMDSMTLPEIPEISSEPVILRRAPQKFVLAAAFVSGFTFFIIELLWYRVSAPLLGGSVYSFGLVLCVALTGMGLGGLLYSLLLKRREPCIEDFVLVSSLQAVTVILPALLGDGFAFGSLVVNYVTRGFGFGSLVAGWAVIMMAMAFLPSFIAGVQFPLLVSLLGRGNAGVGRELGRAYLCNTAGAIAGSLLGGFVLIPLFGLRSCWYGVASLIGLMPVVAVMILNRIRQTKSGASPVHDGTLRTAYFILATGVVVALLVPGPTSVWFHTPIGYGRMATLPNTPEKLEEWKRSIRRSHVESFDGRETSVAVMNNDQYILLTNGKADGSALGDAATQVMLGLTGAALHPAPKRACVIGLGTGTTVGWLADVPTMEHVDAIEIEQRMQDLARLFGPVNRNAMNHPKVTHVVGDAREYLVTGGAGYDLIVSEPSNPYRAGVASLYTSEFYRSVRDRLNEDGILCQWVQGYEALPETIDTVIATLSHEFPKVEVWNTMHNDLLLVASVSTKPWNADGLRARIQQEPFSTALRRLWYTDSAEGFFAHCLANDEFTRQLGKAVNTINTDDLNVLEFSYARSIGKDNSNNAIEYRKKAYGREQMLPRITGKALDDETLERELLSCVWSSSHHVERLAAHKGKPLTPAAARYAGAFEAHEQKKDTVLENLSAELPPKTIQERWLLAVNRSIHGNEHAEESLKEMEPLFPEDVALLRTASAFSRHDYPTARRALIHVCSLLRESAWVDTGLLQPTLNLAEPLSSNATNAAPEDARNLYHALRYPLLAGVGDDMRLTALTGVAGHLNNNLRMDMIDAWGPHFPWRGLPLALRTGTYMTAHDPRLTQSLAELQAFIEGGGELPKPKATAQPGQETAAAH